MYFHAEFPGRGFDALPRSVALGLADAFDLIEARDRISHMRSVVQGFFFFFRECEVLIGYVIALGLIEFAHAGH